MTRDEIIKMAREAGFANVRGGLMDNGEISDYWDCWPGQLERFFHLAYAAGAAAEREAMLDLVDDYAKGNTDLKAAIRARGEK